jgi:hypothetical protein
MAGIIMRAAVQTMRLLRWVFIFAGVMFLVGLFADLTSKAG